MKTTNSRRILCIILVFNFLLPSAFAQDGLGINKFITISPPRVATTTKIYRIDSKSPINLLSGILKNRGNQNQGNGITLLNPLDSCEFPLGLPAPLNTFNRLTPAIPIQRHGTISLPKNTVIRKR